MSKQATLLLALWWLGPWTAPAQVTVHVQSGLGLANVIDSYGAELPDGNTVKLGYFENGFNLPANAGLLPILSLNWHEYGHTTIQTFLDRRGHFGEDLGSFNSEFDGKKIYLWIFKTRNNLQPESNFANVTEYGIFSSSNTASWTFPSQVSQQRETSIFSSDIDQCYHANLIGGTPPVSLQLASAPEPAASMVTMGIGLVLVTIIRQRKRRE